MGNPVENQLNQAKRSVKWGARVPNLLGSLVAGYDKTRQAVQQAELSVATYRAKKDVDFESAQKFQDAHRKFIDTLPGDIESYAHTPLGGLSFRRKGAKAEEAAAKAEDAPKAEADPEIKVSPIKEMKKEGVEFKQQEDTPSSLDWSMPDRSGTPSMFADNPRQGNPAAPSTPHSTKPWWVGSGQGRDPGAAWAAEKKKTTVNEVMGNK